MSKDTIYRQDAIDAISYSDIAYYPEDSSKDVLRKDSVVKKAISELPSAQQDAIPIEWIEKKIEWLKGLDNEFATLTAGNISAMLNQWRGEQNE